MEKKLKKAVRILKLIKQLLHESISIMIDILVLIKVIESII